MIKVFDLDGTLLDSNGIWREIDEIFVRRRGLELTDEYNEFVSHAIFPTAAKFTREYYQLSDSEDEIMNEWYALAQDAYEHQLPLKRGVRRYLEQCAARGERMVVYTSSVPALCKAALKRHALDRHFDALYFAQELMLEKKYPASFTAIAELLHQPPEECVLFDDSPWACTAAKTAGWNVIGVQDPFFEQHQQILRQVCHQLISGFDVLIE